MSCEGSKQCVTNLFAYSLHSLWVFVNGKQLGEGPMATDLPPRVRFAIDLCRPGARVRLLPSKEPPKVTGPQENLQSVS